MNNNSEPEKSKSTGGKNTSNNKSLPKNQENKPFKKKRNRRKGGNKNSLENTRKLKYADCPICGNTVRDLYTAIAYGEENLPCHFDCVIKDLSSKETLGTGEKIIYLGNGVFGVVWVSNSGKTFEVKKQIIIEKKESELEWRKSLAKSTLSETLIVEKNRN